MNKLDKDFEDKIVNNINKQIEIYEKLDKESLMTEEKLNRVNILALLVIIAETLDKINNKIGEK